MSPISGRFASSARERSMPFRPRSRTISAGSDPVGRSTPTYSMPTMRACWTTSSSGGWTTSASTSCRTHRTPTAWSARWRPSPVHSRSTTSRRRGRFWRYRGLRPASGWTRSRPTSPGSVDSASLASSGTGFHWSSRAPDTRERTVSRSRCRSSPQPSYGMWSSGPVSHPPDWEPATRSGSKPACRCTATSSPGISCG